MGVGWAGGGWGIRGRARGASSALRGVRHEKRAANQHQTKTQNVIPPHLKRRRLLRLCFPQLPLLPPPPLSSRYGEPDSGVYCGLQSSDLPRLKTRDATWRTRTPPDRHRRRLMRAAALRRGGAATLSTPTGMPPRPAGDEPAAAEAVAGEGRRASLRADPSFLSPTTRWTSAKASRMGLGQNTSRQSRMRMRRRRATKRMRTMWITILSSIFPRMFVAVLALGE